MSKPRRFVGFLKTTAIGGLLFLLPLIIVGALIGQMIPIVFAVADAIGKVLPLRTPGRIAILVALALAVVLLLCFVAGLLARRSWGKRISGGFEKKLTMFFPRYAILKDQMADTIGGDQLRPTMKPVIARFDDCLRIGFETERAAGDVVTVYLPGAPDPWAGHLVFLSGARVEPLELEFGETVSIIERIGRDSASLLRDRLMNVPR